VIVAPDFSPEAAALLQKKKSLRLMKVLQNSLQPAALEVRSVGAESFLVQESDLRRVTANDLKIVTKRSPTATELQAMLFGWRVVKHVRSNAIVYAGFDRTLGLAPAR